MNISTALRRPLRLAVPLVAVALVATGCSSSGGDDNAAADADSSWSYTDDTGRTVELDQRPERVASYTDYALGLLSYDITPVALFGRFDVASDERFADYDISDTAIVGNSYGEIDLEALAETAPDLIVTGIYPTDREGTLATDGPYYGLADAEQQAQLEKIAPVVAIEVGGAGSDVIDSINTLSEALGASDETIAAAKEEYDAAAADLTAAAEENDLEITSMYADADGVYVTKPMDEPETELYSTLGVDYTDLNPDGYYYWDIYSWENAADMMTGDVLLVNNEGFQQADLEAQPTFASHPALAAGQVHEWTGAALDYASQAAQMTELAGIIRESKPL
ncbi:ABC transporter substrate-binding protein [Frigoribacterium faeni]|uniref:ABC transporter substrate-binding protein n=1 Tax=Frigoribacterium faeni TaxID=145483 RepID=A0A7W3JK12_9MICO|nr:ABC transporter substrate-binding protein [Frigoribacterium faeni]MBA8814253.1 iron complex transport system substrate-binding protein [Frigoribacterium faeni]GEK83655.1 ABC transporter substrate-binding protein [Frigoribacterium faeni]